MRLINQNSGATALFFFLTSFGIFAVTVVNRRNFTANEKALSYTTGYAAFGISIQYFKKWLFATNPYVLMPMNAPVIPVTTNAAQFFP